MTLEITKYKNTNKDVSPLHGQLQLQGKGGLKNFLALGYNPLPRSATDEG